MAISYCNEGVINAAAYESWLNVVMAAAGGLCSNQRISHLLFNAK